MNSGDLLLAEGGRLGVLTMVVVDASSGSVDHVWVRWQGELQSRCVFAQSTWFHPIQHATVIAKDVIPRVSNKQMDAYYVAWRVEKETT